MTDKALVKKVLNKYRLDNRYYILHKSAHFLKSPYNKKETEKYSARIYRKLESCLQKHKYEISIQKLSKECSYVNSPPLDDSELSLFCYSICKIVFTHLLKEKDNVTVKRYMDLVYQLESFDYDSFYQQASSVHKALLKNNPDHYRESDGDTRKHTRRYVYQYAKRHGISQIAAALVYCGQISQPKSWAKYYLPSILIISALTSALTIPFSGIIPALLLFLPVFEAVRTISTVILSRITIPSKIPAIEMEKIPDKGRTVAVVTALIDKPSLIPLISKIEAYHNRCKDDNLCIGILADLGDSGEYHSNKDENDIQWLISQITALNKKYGDRFCLFIRSRSYISTEERFAGKERKRGAVLALCCLLDRGESHFDTVICPKEFLNGTKYVITLDSDTELGMKDAKAMIAAMLHPNNRPVIKDGRVIKGHAILQPKILTSLDSSTSTPFALMMSGVGGTDGYRSVDFELYQTLFARSTFCGKGIIDLKAFRLLFETAFKEESILSHDTLEGGYGRCGYLSHVCLTDSFPQNPVSYYKRYHRWLRGDIQSLPFTAPFITNKDNIRVKNPLDTLGKIMVFDNAQRAFLPTAVFASLMIACFTSLKASLIITLLATLHITIPFILAIINTSRNSPRKFYSNAIKGLSGEFCRVIFELAAIPSKFFISFDAILRAIWRMTISKKHLMQWVTAEAGEKIRVKFPQYLFKFWFSLLIGAITFVWGVNPYFSFFSVLWILFFLICFCLSSKYPNGRKISQKNKQQLLKYSLDCWYYFAHTVGEKTNHLPPDNYQISPVKRLAMRTSPTNIGLYLLCCGAAYKFSFITKEELEKRIVNTLDTIDNMAKYKGHLYNWYDIQSLEVLGTPYVSTVDSGNFLACLYSLAQILKETEGLSYLSQRITKICKNMPLEFLFNKEKKLFSIGMDTSEPYLDDNCYDILMSEVRTAVYIAICRKEVDEQVYYKMACPVITQNGHLGLASWSGTAFEYFMPALFLPVYNNSLYYEALGFALSQQISDKVKGIWGRSESGYFAFDHNMNYQYRAFGVPDLAIDPEIAKHNVISPYSSFLALCMSYRHPCSNLHRMEKMGLYGKYGFYEAMDFSYQRVGNGNAIIYSWMSHHVAMSMLAATNACFDNYIVKSFMKDPQMSCGDCLLKRKIPVDIKLSRQTGKRKKQLYHRQNYQLYTGESKWKNDPDKLPSSSQYSNSIMSFNAFSNGSLGFYLQNIALSYPFFHSGHNLRGVNMRVKIDGKIIDPLKEAAFSSFMTGVGYEKNNGNTQTTLLTTLHGEYNAICINLTVRGEFNDITTLLTFEPILDRIKGFEAHPAFSGLSVTCKYDEQTGLLIFQRKKRDNPHQSLFLAVCIGGGGEFEFITRRDIAFDMLYGESDIDKLCDMQFDNQDGCCIHPLCCIKKRSVSIKKEGKKSLYSINFVIIAAESQEEIYATVNKFRHDKVIHQRGFTAAFSQSMEGMAKEQIALAKADYNVIDLCSALRSHFYFQSYQHKQNYSPSHTHNLYRQGISNDLPIVCLNLKDTTEPNVLKLVEIFARANRYMRCTSCPFDLVIVFQGEQSETGYFTPKKDSLITTLEKWTGSFALNQRGGVFIIDRYDDGKDISPLANLDFDIDSNCVFSQIIRIIQNHTQSINANEGRIIKRIGGDIKSPTSGSFEERGFVIKKGISKRPWSYTYSSPSFGTLITQNSLGFSWLGNSRQQRLTPWSNDPLLDLTGERLILKMEEKEYDLAAICHTVEFNKSNTIFKGSLGGIEYTLEVGISIDLPFKYVVFSAVNHNPAPSSFSVGLKTVPALGDKGGCNYKVSLIDGMEIYTNLDGMSSGDIRLFATSGEKSFHTEGGGGCKYCFVSGAVKPNDDKTFYKILTLIKEKDFHKQCQRQYQDFYSKVTDCFTLKSDCPEIDTMFNYYAPYQVYCQRILARSGFYQSGGAFGFRDQLQDALALVSNQPTILKNQIIKCASKQFCMGDVLHWWHENSQINDDISGVRTKCSDDYLWLPYCVAQYVLITGDKDILDLEVGYIEGDYLKEDEKERCMTVTPSNKSERLYYHCIRAIQLALDRRDEKGLCLIGSCDWNDGFSNVGSDDKGYSVWLTKFLQLVLSEFAKICDSHYKELFLRKSKELYRAVEENCFNGQYYIRASFADGTPLGDKDCDECKIDLLPQAFAAITDGITERSQKAMSSALDLLYDRENHLLSLFAPPFENSDICPGYVMAYPPGIRENGGQYNHGAIWGAWACFCLNKNYEGLEILKATNPAYRYSHPKLNKSYGGEPYAFAGDIYTNPQHKGKAGWTLYTGSAGWFYSIVLNQLLGYNEYGGKHFKITPRLCKGFTGFELTVNKYDTLYRIKVMQGDKNSFVLDERIVNNHFEFDKGSHFLKITVAKD